MNRPLLLGHRGMRALGTSHLSQPLAEENSLEAFEFALERGCDGFEFDVRRTRDGRNVIWHDAACRAREIASTEYAELADRQGSPPALLEDVLRQFGHRAYFDIELKVAGCEESVVAALLAHPPVRGVIVSSFLPEVLGRLHELAPDLPLGYICDRRLVLSLWRELPIQVLLPHYSLVPLELITEVHQSGLQIMTWTVNDSRKMLEFAEARIDGLISDDPGLLYQTFHSG